MQIGLDLRPLARDVLVYASDWYWKSPAHDQRQQSSPTCSHADGVVDNSVGLRGHGSFAARRGRSQGKSACRFSTAQVVL